MEKKKFSNTRAAPSHAPSLRHSGLKFFSPLKLVEKNAWACRNYYFLTTRVQKTLDFRMVYDRKFGTEHAEISRCPKGVQITIIVQCVEIKLTRKIEILNSFLDKSFLDKFRNLKWK